MWSPLISTSVVSWLTIRSPWHRADLWVACRLREWTRSADGSPQKEAKITWSFISWRIRARLADARPSRGERRLCWGRERARLVTCEWQRFKDLADCEHLYVCQYPGVNFPYLTLCINIFHEEGFLASRDQRIKSDSYYTSLLLSHLIITSDFSGCLKKCFWKLKRVFYLTRDKKWTSPYICMFARVNVYL